MYSEGQDRSRRVRQIPIKVEPRDPADEEPRRASSRQQYQTPDNNNDRQNQENLWDYRQAQHDNSQRSSDHGQTLPNTSSINIDYQPQQAQRDQNRETRGANSSRTSRSSKDRRSGAGRIDPENQPQVKGKYKTPSLEDVPPNPGAIPMPPPPERNDHNSSSSANRTDESNHRSDSSLMPEEEKILSKINEVKMDITNLLEKISQFKDTSSKSKEYRFLDEMLTRCVLNLDKIECGNSSNMRQQRRATIKSVDQTTHLLQRQLQLNIEIHELTISMSTN